MRAEGSSSCLSARPQAPVALCMSQQGFCAKRALIQLVVNTSSALIACLGRHLSMPLLPVALCLTAWNEDCNSVCSYDLLEALLICMPVIIEARSQCPQPHNKVRAASSRDPITMGTALKLLLHAILRYIKPQPCAGASIAIL